MTSHALIVLKYYLALVSLLCTTCSGLANASDRSHLAPPHTVRAFWIIKDNHLPQKGYSSPDLTALSPERLKEFQRLFNHAAFVRGRYSFNCFSAIINSHAWSRGTPFYHGGIWLSDMLHPLFVLVAYNPFTRILYLSDDEYDDYGNGLIISNVPSEMISYHLLDSRYPEWMNRDVTPIKEELNGLELDIGISTFHRDAPSGWPFHYLVPYLHATFGTNVILRSSTLAFEHNDFQFIGHVAPQHTQDYTRHDLEFAIGTNVFRVTENNYLKDSFFIALTNAITIGAKDLRNKKN